MKLDEPNSRQRDDGLLAHKQVAFFVKLVRLVKDYSLHSLLFVLVSVIAYIAYERKAYETKLSMKSR